MVRALLLGSLTCLALAHSAAAERLALVGATIIDGNGGAPIADGVIVLDGDRIEAVGPRSSTRVPRGARVEDVTGRWIMPGLIDAHVHFFQSGGLYTRPDAFDLRSVRPYLDDLNWSKANLDATFARYLASGVTAVVDAGGPLWNFEVRRRANDAARAPRVAVAGPLIATEPPQTEALDAAGDPPIMYAETAERAQVLARALLPQEPDFIKIWGIGTGPEGIARVREITAAIVEVANAANTRVAVHATELEVARAAVEGGADVLVHSVFDLPVDQPFIDALLARDVVYVTTVAAYQGYAEAMAGDPNVTPIEEALADPSVIASLYEAPQFLRNAASLRPADRDLRQAQDNARALVNAGARVAVGTDAGNIGTLHGPAIHRELQLLVAAGLTPMQAITAATRDAAFVYAADPEIGVLRAGARADLLILSADPLADIGNAARIERVLARGIGYEPRSLIEPSPAGLVQRQVDAYNAHDLDAFVATYAENAELFDLPDAATPTVSGREALRSTYGGLFERFPSLSCAVVNRAIEGVYVIDQEFCTIGPNEPSVRGTAIYHVENGLIRRVWFAAEGE